MGARTHAQTEAPLQAAVDSQVTQAAQRREEVVVQRRPVQGVLAMPWHCSGGGNMLRSARAEILYSCIRQDVEHWSTVALSPLCGAQHVSFTPPDGLPSLPRFSGLRLVQRCVLLPRLL